MNRLRLLAVIEAETITGPAKNLLQFAHTLCSETLETAADLAVATFIRRGRGGTNVFVEAAEKMGIPLFPIPEAGRFDRSTLATLRDLAGRFQPNLIQTHAVKSHFLMRCSGLPRTLPWIAFHHGYTWPDLRVRLYNQLDRWSLRAPTRMITVSQWFRAQLVERGVRPERIDVVHNAIDPQWGRRVPSPTAEALRHRLGLAPDQAVILIVGRLSAEKDHVTLLRALAEVYRRCPGRRPHLLVVGDGPERPRIERAIASLGLGDRVTLAGQQESAEPFYALAHVAVLSSLSEGSPNALLEALAAGVPAVATRVGGIPEIVTDRESSLLVEPGDVTRMAEMIIEVLSDPGFAASLTQRAYQVVCSHYSPVARARRLCEIYRQTLESWRPEDP